MNNSSLNPIAIHEIAANVPTLFETKASSGHPEPFVMVSKPGQAKSDTIEGEFRLALQNYLGRPVMVITDMPANRDPMDYKGYALPVKREGKHPVSVYTIPDLIERIERCAAEDEFVILFLDELLQADSLTQKPLADLLLNYRLGEHTLPDNVWIVGATNWASDGAGANRALTHLANRINWFATYLPMDNWVRWARKAGLPAAGIAYAQMQERAFIEPEIAKDGPFLTYRSFSKGLATLQAHKDTKGIDDPRVVPDTTFLRRALEGRIGIAHATQFYAFASVMETLPSRQEILEHPNTAKVPEVHRVDAQYAVASVTVDIATREGATYDQVNACCDYALRLIPDLAAKALIDIKQSPNGGAVLNSPKVGKWLMDNRALLTAIYSA
jgi:hypothetical protein